MTDTQIYAGTLEASHTDRTATGLLVPFGEECSSNLGRFKVDSGAFSIPADLTGVSLNVEHEREQVVGAVSKLTTTDKGIVATFTFAQTDEGEKALQDARSGKRKNLSAEVADVVITAGKAVAGRLFAASLVKAGAFPSATLLAAAADTVSSSHYESEFTDANGVKWKRIEDSESTRVTEETDTGTKTTYVSTATEEVQPAEADSTTKEPAVGAATVPNTLTAGHAVTTERPAPVSLPTLYAAINRAKVRQATTEDMTLLASTSSMLGGSPEQVAATLLAALSDIKISGSGSLPVGGAAIQPNWVGQITQGITYERQFVPLAKTGTEITAEGKKGYKVHRGTSGAPVDSYADTGIWAGNKAAIGSGTGWTEPVTSTLHRFAFGDDIAREYYDLPGGAEVLAAFFALIKEDHLVWSDERARLAWITLAGAPVAASGAIPSDYPATLGMIMQAIRLAQKPKADKRRDKVSFAIVNDEAADALSYTPFEKIPNFIKFSWNLDGTGITDGDIVLVNGDNGITGSPAVTAGAKYALELAELPGGPLWIDALNIANGGVDRAIHGYLQEFQTRPEAVVTVGTPETRANSTAYPVGRLIKASAVIYRVTVAGTSGGSAPSAPAVGATVADGGATLLRLA